MRPLRSVVGTARASLGLLGTKSDRFTVLLPLGARAAAWLNKYVEEARSKLVVEPDEREVFLCVLAASLGAAQRLHSPPS